jgi:flavorubredoxin
MEELASNVAIKDLTHIVITHLDPKAIPTLKTVLKIMAQAGKMPTVVLSNPGLRLLQSVLGECVCLSMCMRMHTCVYVCVLVYCMCVW